jgi:plastocyanin
VSGATAARSARLLAGCLAAIALFGTASAASKAAPKSARVTVNDFFFAPTAVTIAKGGAVKWVWSAANSNPHTVHLKSGPKGLEDKGSYSTRTSAVSEARFRKTFETAGTYKYICTIHPTLMKMTVVVKR